MNRLIIIGNGFDLAHGLKTSCKSLVLYYLSTIWSNLSNNRYEDQLVNINNASEYFKHNDLNYSESTAISLFNDLLKSGTTETHGASMNIKSKFFESIFKKITDLNWADAETEYFNVLYYIIENANKRKERTNDRIGIETYKNDQVLRLNKDIEHLQKYLIKHLKEQENNFNMDGKTNSLYLKYFKESFYEGETIIPNRTYPNKTLFLNFNYTNTLSKYINNEKIIYIHGTLDNQPIFGFGDDTSEKYYNIENEYNNEFLKRIKSFRYLDNGKYSELVRFMNQGPFHAQIFGHSCGVSDRTLFKQIFENSKCERIKIFFHNHKDFEEKKYEISRHFKDKVEFLNKVVSLENLREMPQI